MKNSKVMILLVCCGLLGTFLYFHVNKGQEPPTDQAETVEDETGKEEGNHPFEVPATYKKELPDSCLSFDAEIIVPEGFDAENLYLGTGIKNLDSKKMFDICFQGSDSAHWETEEYTNSWGEKEIEEIAEDENGNYMITEGKSALYYMKEPESVYVDNCVRLDDNPGNNQDKLSEEKELDFMDRNQVKKEVESKIEEMGISTEGNQYHIFALDVETLKEEEKVIDMQGNVAEDEKNPKWTKEQETYYIFGEQTFQGIPVYAGKGVADTGSFDVIANYPIQVQYNSRGIASCRLENSYQITRGNEKVKLASFEKVIEAIEEKFGDLNSSDACDLVVRKIKLMEFPKHQQDGTYQMIPIWICYMDIFEEDGTKWSWYKQMPINAVTGEEELSIVGDIM